MFDNGQAVIDRLALHMEKAVRQSYYSGFSTGFLAGMLITIALIWAWYEWRGK